ncbi:MAG: hypothetical protein IKU44_02875 [Firmicutes bacterium]|nr:hypothetical protein [Bacillota bacterium]
MLTPNWYDNSLKSGQTYYYKIYGKGYETPLWTVCATVPALTHDAVSQHDWKPVLDNNVEYVTESKSSFRTCYTCFYTTNSVQLLTAHFDDNPFSECVGWESSGSFNCYKRVDNDEYVDKYICECGATRTFELE